ncbi:MAG: diacylglycerol kinase family lipid kinase [Slackia sp.]|nr:diacylglycerol kinase family lipid kinase [Slackia sp.]
MEKALLIVNPDSGKQEGSLLARRIASMLEETFGVVECRLSSCADDVRAWACEARESHVDELFVMGGDGTVGLGLQGLFEGACASDSMPAFCVIPNGTGNGLARTLGIPSDAQRAVAAYDFSRTRAFDVGFVNERPFAYTVTGGTLPEGIRDVPSEAKTRFGFLAYAISELLRVGSDERHTLRIVADGREVVEDVSSFVAFSANALVNDFTTAHDTRVDSGKMHLIALKSASVASLLSLVPNVIARSIDENDQVLFLHGESIEVSCLDSVLTCGVDGDEGPSLPVRLSVRPGALRMFALKDGE